MFSRQLVGRTSVLEVRRPRPGSRAGPSAWRLNLGGANQSRGAVVTQDDVLFGYRLQLFRLAEELGVSKAYRVMGVNRSTYYRWKPEVERAGLEHCDRESGADR